MVEETWMTKVTQFGSILWTIEKAYYFLGFNLYGIYIVAQDWGDETIYDI